jgi:pimeloyl-ACP methyl ester carboxylesterase
MRLYVHEWGDGDRTALLVHGITSDSGSWWQVGPELAARGYHVYAPHLRGHGHSGRGPYSVETWADDLAESVPAEPELAIGHSLGGLVLAAALDRLRPRRVVYEDPAWFPPTTGRAETAQRFRVQTGWTLADIQAAFPRWEPAACEAKLAALGRWDAATTEFVTEFDGIEPKPPTSPALLMLADPSTLIVPEKAAELRRAGFGVRVVPGAGHVIHNDDITGFFAALDGWV